MKEYGLNVHERNFKYIKAKHSERKNADIGQYNRMQGKQV